jgi:hypothetical protein
MRWKQWLPCFLSLVLACASAREPVLTLTMDSSWMGWKRHIVLTDRKYTVIIVNVTKDGKMTTSKREGTLSKETYRELLRLMDALKMDELKSGYADKNIQITNINATTLGLTYKGRKASVFLLGLSPPKELAPILDLITPLIHT